MVKGLYTAYTGMINEQRRMDILSNNLANANTTGYKKEGATSAAFADELALRIHDSSWNYLPQGLGDINMGVKIGQTYTNYDQGSFKVTDVKSDLAIDGNGFFAIEFLDKQGNASVKYTRDGAFTVDENGYIVTSDGDHLLNRNAALSGQTGEAGWVQIDPLQDYAVDREGNIWQNEAIVGDIGLVDLDNYDYFEKYGENLYNVVEGGNIAAADGQIVQGTLEASNVNVVDEMVNLIAISRAYEANQKMIQTEDTTMEMAVSQVGQVG